MKLSYDEFKARFVEDIKDYLPPEFEDCKVQVESVTKNNNCTMEGIVIRGDKKEGEHHSVAPILYLNNVYKDYENGSPYYEVLENTAKVYVNAVHHREANSIIDKITYALENPELFKEMVQFRLANAERNADALENAPHRYINDIAITYVCSPKEAPEYCVRITNDVMEHVGITEEELYTSAMANLKSERTTFRNMGEVIAEMTGMPLEFAPETPMYVLTNETNFGSRTILNSELLEDIRKELGENYYILPSTIHEVIIVKEGLRSPEELREIVYNANKGILEEKNFLSDNVYYYDGMLKMHDSPEIEW